MQEYLSTYAIEHLALDLLKLVAMKLRRIVARILCFQMQTKSSLNLNLYKTICALPLDKQNQTNN